MLAKVLHALDVRVRHRVSLLRRRLRLFDLVQPLSFGGLLQKGVLRLERNDKQLQAPLRLTNYPVGVHLGRHVRLG